MFEDGSETPHSWTKGNTNEHLCWHSSKHWKRLKPFREHNNLWWIIFFYQYDPESKRQSMRWKSPSSSRQKKAQQSKSKFKAMMVFFSEGLFTWIGCLKVRLLTRSTTRRLWQTFVNGWEEEDLKGRKMAHRFFTKKTRRHIMPCLSRHFWRSTRSPCWNIHRTHLT